ncbi:unnamed protein product [Rangifer tarandus platyrhynchus]|uniref:Uncharacterized protein n=1 Tax=Rangifer tarandus platyrhynchus TaxID=3082113 RepID=A0AC59YFI6_RANTA
MGLAEMLTASAQTSSGAGKHWPNLVFFRAKRKMQRLLSLKKDRRPRSQGVRKTPGTPASSRSRPGSRLAVAPARTTYRPGAAARGPPTARCPARRPRLRCLCVPATRLEDLGAEPPTRGAEPQILTFPTVSAKCARSHSKCASAPPTQLPGLITCQTAPPRPERHKDDGLGAEKRALGRGFHPSSSPAPPPPPAGPRGHGPERSHASLT